MLPRPVTFWSINRQFQNLSLLFRHPIFLAHQNILKVECTLSGSDGTIYKGTKAAKKDL